MREVLQQVLSDLEQAYDNPNAADLEQSIKQLQAALEQYGDKGTMIENAITALTQAKNSIMHIGRAKDNSPEASFGQAHNALEQAIESLREIDNDPV